MKKKVSCGNAHKGRGSTIGKGKSLAFFSGNGLFRYVHLRM